MSYREIIDIRLRDLEMEIKMDYLFIDIDDLIDAWNFIKNTGIDKLIWAMLTRMAQALKVTNWQSIEGSELACAVLKEIPMRYLSLFSEFVTKQDKKLYDTVWLRLVTEASFQEFYDFYTIEDSSKNRKRINFNFLSSGHKISAQLIQLAKTEEELEIVLDWFDNKIPQVDFIFMLAHKEKLKKIPENRLKLVADYIYSKRDRDMFLRVVGLKKYLD